MIDYSSVKVGDKLRIVGAGAPGFAKLGELETADPKGFITAPEGGWTSNPVPGRVVEVQIRSVGHSPGPSDAFDWPWRIDDAEQDIIAFRLVEEATPASSVGTQSEGRSEPDNLLNQEAEGGGELREFMEMLRIFGPCKFHGRTISYQALAAVSPLGGHRS